MISICRRESVGKELKMNNDMPFGYCSECGSEQETILEKEVEPGVTECHFLCPVCLHVEVDNYIEQPKKHIMMKPMAEIKITDENRAFFDALFASDDE